MKTIASRSRIPTQIRKATRAHNGNGYANGVHGNGAHGNGKEVEIDDCCADGTAEIAITSQNMSDLSRETNGEVLLLFTVSASRPPASATIAMRCAGVATSCGSAAIALPAQPKFVRYGMPLKCLASKGVDMTKVSAPFVLTTQGTADIALGQPA